MKLQKARQNQITDPAKQSYYVVAAGRSVALGLGPHNSFEESSGQYQYLHFIRLSITTPLEIYTFEGQPMS